MKKLLLIFGVLGLGVVGYLAFYHHEPSGHPGEPAPVAPLAATDLAALKLKAEQGDPESQARLGKMYATGQSVTMDYRQAAKWYQQAADKGNPDAQAGLGELYQIGQGVNQDAAMAAKLYRS